MQSESRFEVTLVKISDDQGEFLLKSSKNREIKHVKCQNRCLYGFHVVHNALQITLVYMYSVFCKLHLSD